MGDDNEIDLYQFAKLFDAALASDNPSVKKALRNFLLVASIVEAEEGQVGPMSTVFERVDSLERKVDELTNAIRNMNQRTYIGDSTWPGDTYYDWNTPSKWTGTTTVTNPSKLDTSYEIDFAELYRKMGSTTPKGKK